MCYKNIFHLISNYLLSTKMPPKYNIASWADRIYNPLGEHE